MSDVITEAAQEAEAIQAHQTLLNRIAAQATAEGCPLTPAEVQTFEPGEMRGGRSDGESHASRDYHTLMNRISGLLERAIAEDRSKDPEAPQRYAGLVQKLEARRGSLTLWACCVPAFQDYKSVIFSRYAVIVQVIIGGIVLAIILWMVFKSL